MSGADSLVQASNIEIRLCQVSRHRTKLVCDRDRDRQDELVPAASTNPAHFPFSTVTKSSNS
jgi:hypothetical protein